MRKRSRKGLSFLLILAAGGWLGEAGCLRDIQREIDLLYRPEANLDFIRDSVLVDIFGHWILAPLDS
jgi:hypothetical protein